MMSDLPAERLGYCPPPFSSCGVDYFGSFYVTIRRSSEKRWGFLLTCLATRAIHIELVPSMDTSSFELTIERFISRRGTPSIIWSDNGTNFVGAEKDLILCIENWNTEAPLSLVHKGIKWKYNPPRAPHQGGAWERMVRSCKRVFYAISGSRKLTDEILNTTMFLVEGSLNALPRTSVSDDPDSLEALTPNHFLLGQHSLTFPSLKSSENYSHSKRYARAQSYSNAIWQRWLSEYVLTLKKRSKWHFLPEYFLKTGYMVWLVESTLPRGHYPLARKMSLNYGKDNTACSANLRTVFEKYSRTLVKLVPVLALYEVEDVNAT